jgi:hypothetical protein
MAIPGAASASSPVAAAGEHLAEPLGDMADDGAAEGDAERLRQIVEAQRQEIARLQAKAGAPAGSASGKVYTPTTPHGAERLAASEVGTMTTAQVAQAIDDGLLPEPLTSYLCADGYLARRSTIPA